MLHSSFVPGTQPRKTHAHTNITHFLFHSCIKTITVCTHLCEMCFYLCLFCGKASLFFVLFSSAKCLSLEWLCSRCNLLVFNCLLLQLELSKRFVFSVAVLSQGAEQPEKRAGRWNQWGQSQLWKHTKHQWEGEITQQHMWHGMCVKAKPQARPQLLMCDKYQASFPLIVQY